jgi:hypothetical protein
MPRRIRRRIQPERSMLRLELTPGDEAHNAAAAAIPRQAAEQHQPPPPPFSLLTYAKQMLEQTTTRNR